MTATRKTSGNAAKPIFNLEICLPGSVSNLAASEQPPEAAFQESYKPISVFVLPSKTAILEKYDWRNTMNKPSYCEIIRDETNRALWEVDNVIHCVPDRLWNKLYCEMPIWKHIYHLLHSLDQWYINPRVYTQPAIHKEGLNNLDFESKTALSRKDIEDYFEDIKKKIIEYDNRLTDDLLLQKPECCEWSRFELIFAQHRHLHSHMGMLMGFIVKDTGLWPYTLGLERPIPHGDFGTFF